MLTCAECKASDCANVGIETNACDNFTTLEEVGATAPAPPLCECPVCKEWHENLDDRLSLLEQQVDKLIDGLRTAAMGAWEV